LFHVEHDFNEVSLAYRRALQQRNVALRRRDPSYQAWDSQLASYGERLNRYRETYLPTLERLVAVELAALEQDYALTLRLRPGWPEAVEGGLVDVLRGRRGEDRERGYTTAGPHRATLEVLVDGIQAERRLSRGQQKLLIYALFLGLAGFVVGEGGEPPVLLIDDLPAELDARHLDLLLQRLADRGLQCWITAVHLDVDTASPRNKVFHVEHGRVTER
jgi:DNA replication and repair protein RecF